MPAKIIAIVTSQNVYYKVGKKIAGSLWHPTELEITSICLCQGDPSSYVVTLEDGQHIDIYNAVEVCYAASESPQE
ncbi:MAG: hypothetical protein LC126_15580 [Bryobacterales bacterium]|nr:hypothetical protein [Bryobacterales bacterium]